MRFAEHPVHMHRLQTDVPTHIVSLLNVISHVFRDLRDQCRRETSSSMAYIATRALAPIPLSGVCVFVIAYNKPQVVRQRTVKGNMCVIREIDCRQKKTTPRPMPIASSLKLCGNYVLTRHKSAAPLNELDRDVSTKLVDLCCCKYA